MARAHPEIAVISVGEGNQYDHPHHDTLDKLTFKDVIVYRTDLSGTVTITTDGRDYHVKMEQVYPTQPPIPEPESTPEPMLEPEPEPEEEPDKPSGIPGFGFESILICVVISMLVILLMSRRFSS